MVIVKEKEASGVFSRSLIEMDRANAGMTFANSATPLTGVLHRL